MMSETRATKEKEIKLQSQTQAVNFRFVDKEDKSIYEYNSMK